MELKESGFQFLNPRIKYTEFIVNDNFDSSLYKGIGISCKKEEKRMENNSAQVDFFVWMGIWYSRKKYTNIIESKCVGNAGIVP